MKNYFFRFNSEIINSIVEMLSAKEGNSTNTRKSERISIRKSERISTRKSERISTRKSERISTRKRDSEFMKNGLLFLILLIG